MMADLIKEVGNLIFTKITNQLLALEVYPTVKNTIDKRKFIQSIKFKSLYQQRFAE